MEHGGLLSKQEIAQVWVKMYDSNIERLVPDSDISLLCHFTGNDGDTTTVDSSQWEHSITMNGTAQIDSAIVYDSNFGTTCLLDGSGDFEVPGTDKINVFTTGDFWTVEFFVKHSSLTGVQIYYSQYDNPNHAQIYHEQGVGLRCTAHLVNTTGSEITDTNWHHVAYVRHHPTASAFYLDGQQVGWQSVAGIAWTLVDTKSRVGRSSTGSENRMLGNIDEFRISKGNIYGLSPNAGLTDTFTPPAVPYTPDAYDPMVITVDPTYTGFYKFKIFLVNAYPGVSNYFISVQPSGTYTMETLVATGASISASSVSGSGFWIGSIDNLEGVAFADVIITVQDGKAKSYSGTVVSRVSGVINQEVRQVGGRCSYTGAIISFTVFSDRTKGLGTGTRVIMYQRTGE